MVLQARLPWSRIFRTEHPREPPNARMLLSAWAGKSAGDSCVTVPRQSARVVRRQQRGESQMPLAGTRCKLYRSAALWIAPRAWWLQRAEVRVLDRRADRQGWYRRRISRE